jgi:hypothetical protein
MLHVWVVPYPGGVFSDDLSQAATNSAVSKPPSPGNRHQPSSRCCDQAPAVAAAVTSSPRIVVFAYRRFACRGLVPVRFVDRLCQRLRVLGLRPVPHHTGRFTPTPPDPLPAAEGSRRSGRDLLCLERHRHECALRARPRPVAEGSRCGQHADGQVKSQDVV